MHTYMRTIQIILLVLIIIGLGLLVTQKMWVPGLVQFILDHERAGAPASSGETSTSSPSTVPSGDGVGSVVPAKNYKDATYLFEGQPVRLTNGMSEVPAAPGSASKITTKYFGNEVRRDLNGDGREDIAFLITQNTGGSGTFYYLVAAINTVEGYVGSHAALIGDRISPQTTEITRRYNQNIVVVNYADRNPGESFATMPSVGKTIWFLLDPRTRMFGQVEKDFSGEADPSRMTLSMKSWTWVEALYNDGRKVAPRNPARPFTLTFVAGGRFSAATDCNGVGGTYTVQGQNIRFENMVSTLMYCPDSQESEFTQLLTNTSGYHFTSKGELILDLKFDSGSVVFK